MYVHVSTKKATVLQSGELRMRMMIFSQTVSSFLKSLMILILFGKLFAVISSRNCHNIIGKERVASDLSAITGIVNDIIDNIDFAVRELNPSGISGIGIDGAVVIDGQNVHRTE